MVYQGEPLFRDRVDAGRCLAERLDKYRGGEVVVFAIPRGGVPVATEVARRLDCPLDIVIPRKIPIPSEPEAGYGAVAEDGTIVLNESLVKGLGLSKEEISFQAGAVRAEIERRSIVYRGSLPAPPSLQGRTAIIIDDGLASGFTMIAAIRSLRKRKAAETVVSVPVASGAAYDLVTPEADEVVCLHVSRSYPFAVASFYKRWHDLIDDEVFKYLEEWQSRRSLHRN